MNHFKLPCQRFCTGVVRWLAVGAWMIALCMPGSLFAQSHEITGKVLDENGMPVVGANIIVDALTAKYPKKLQNFLFSAQFVFDGILTVFFIYGSVIFVAQTKAEGSVGVTGMPLWIIYLAPLVGFALNLIRDIQMFIKTIKSSDEVSVS